MANIYRPFPGDITRVHGIRVGQAQNAQAMTGVTVVLPQAEGAVGGVSVRGAAPGTRETDLLRPGNLVVSGADGRGPGNGRRARAHRARRRAV